MQRRQRRLRAESFLLPAEVPEVLRGEAAGKAQLVELDDDRRGGQLVHAHGRQLVARRGSAGFEVVPDKVHRPPQRSCGNGRRNRAVEERIQQAEKEPAENKKQETPKL